MQKNGTTPIFRKFTYLHALVLCGIFALLDTLVFGITDLDEGFYSTIARGMAKTGNFLVPTYLGQPWFEKPPLIYWLSGGAMKVFGYNEFAFRLPAVLAFCGILAMLAVWGNKRLGRNIGYIAALIFATSPLTMYLGRVGLTDMVLACCLTAAILAMWETAEKPVWCIAWGAATGLAILAKGPVGLGLVGIQWLLGIGLLRQRGFKMRWMFAALAITFAVATPWYAAIWLKYGSKFFHDFIVQQNLARFAGGDTAHAVSNPVIYLLYYVLLVAIGFFPFSMFASRKLTFSPEKAYIARWCWLVFALFTLSKTKLPAYILPMLPGFAMLIAAALSSEKPADSAWRRVGVVIVGLIWIAGMVAVTLMSRSPMPLLLAAGFVGVCIPLVMKGPRPFGPTAMPVHPAAVLVLLLGFSATMQTYDAMELKPIRSLALSTPGNSPLVVYNFPHTFPSLYFYRGDRPTLTTEKPDEALDILSKGGYCLTIKGEEPKGNWIVVNHSKTSSKEYVLLKKP